MASENACGGHQFTGPVKNDGLAVVDVDSVSSLPLPFELSNVMLTAKTLPVAPPMLCAERFVVVILNVCVAGATAKLRELEPSELNILLESQ